MQQNRGVFGVNLGHLWDVHHPMQGQLAAFLDHHGEGLVRAVVERCYPSREAGDTHGPSRRGRTAAS